MSVIKFKKEDVAVKEDGEVIRKFTIHASSEIVSIDTNELTSRKATKLALDHLMTDICTALNKMVPFPFYFEVGYPTIDDGETIPIGYEAFFRLSMIVHPLRSLSYMFLKKIPFFGQYVSGPKIISHLFLSDAQKKRMPNGE